MSKMFPHPFSGVAHDRPEGVWVKAMLEEDALLNSKIQTIKDLNPTSKPIAE